MLKWLTKFVLDIMPSVTATIIGAYIVNYYIIPRAAPPSAAITTSDPASAEVKAAAVPTGPGAANPKSASAKPAPGRSGADKSPNDAIFPEKASFEKAVAEKTAIEKTAEKVAGEKADKPADAAAGEPRRRQLASKTAAAKSGLPANAGVASIDTTPDGGRGANDLVRAAVERLRGGKADVAKTPDIPQIQPVSSVAVATPMQPLPPAINVATPNPEVFDSGAARLVEPQPYPQTALERDNPNRPTPPADILGSRPIDLRAQASASPPGRSSVADDVVSAARSVFQAVLPH